MAFNKIERAVWHKSSYSGGGGGNCVEVADLFGETAVRDTRNRELGHLASPLPSGVVSSAPSRRVGRSRIGYLGTVRG